MAGSLEPERVDQPTLPLRGHDEAEDVYLLRPGQRLVGRYTIERRLGWGRFGQTYLARSDGGKDVAVKVVLSHAEVERRGIEACINLNHPHLVTIYDAYHFDGEGHGLPTAVMEYVEGPSLRDLLRDRPGGLGEAAAMELLRQIAAGVDFLHERGIVHRDLKPGNILCGDGGAKICDYGLAKPMDHMAQTTMVGTLPYRPPDSNLRDGRAVDLYAMAVILCEMLTGRMPFTGRSDHELLLAQWQGEADLGAVREPFATVIRRSLSKDPADWFGSAQEMVDAVGDAAPAGEGRRSWERRRAAGRREPAGAAGAGAARAAPAHAIDPMTGAARVFLSLLCAAAVAGGLAVIAPPFYGAAGGVSSAVWGWLAFAMMVGGVTGVRIADWHLRGLDGSDGGARLHTWGGYVAIGVTGAVFAWVAGFVAALLVSVGEPWRPYFGTALTATVIGLLLVGWRGRLDPWRRRRLSVGHVLLSAGVGMLVGSILSGGAGPGMGVFAAFALAGMSLAVQTAAPFAARATGAAVDGEALTTPMAEVVGVAEAVEPPPAPRVGSPPARIEAEPVSSYRALIALLLCLVPLVAPPICGLHRFYVGKIGTGILWLVTFGLLGVGQLIDGILIVAGHFRDHYGDRLRIWVHRHELPWGAEAPAQAEAAPVPAAADDAPGHVRRVARRTGRVGGVLCGLGAAALLGVAIFVSVGLSAGGPEVAAEIQPGLAAEMEQAGLRPELLRRLGAVAVALLMLWAAVLLMVGRRWGGSGHMLRGLGAVAVLWLALAAVGRALETVSWTGVGSMLGRGEIGPAIEQVTSQAAAGWAWAAAGLGLAALLILLQPAAEQEPEAPSCH